MPTTVTEFALVGRPITIWNLLLWQGNGNIWFSVLVDSEASWTRIFKCMWRINSEPCRPQTQHVVAQVSLMMRAQLFLFQWKCIQVCQFRENSLDNGYIAWCSIDLCITFVLQDIQYKKWCLLSIKWRFRLNTFCTM